MRRTSWPPSQPFRQVLYIHSMYVALLRHAAETALASQTAQCHPVDPIPPSDSPGASSPGLRRLGLGKSRDRRSLTSAYPSRYIDVSLPLALSSARRSTTAFGSSPRLASSSRIESSPVESSPVESRRLCRPRGKGGGELQALPHGGRSFVHRSQTTPRRKRKKKLEKIPNTTEK